jgi:hypothetical protein
MGRKPRMRANGTPGATGFILTNRKPKSKKEPDRSGKETPL